MRRPVAALAVCGAEPGRVGTVPLETRHGKAVPLRRLGRFRPLNDHRL